jgi:hypothetical protein
MIQQLTFLDELNYNTKQIKSIHDLENIFNMYRLQGKWKHFSLIDILRDGITIVANSGELTEAREYLKKLLGDVIQIDATGYFIRIGERLIPIFWEENEIKGDTVKPFAFRPLLKDTILLSKTTTPDAIDERLFNVFPYDDKKISATAFFSFKGGVGRTLHLAALCKYLAEQIKSEFKTPKILLVDADTEAPGLSWWAYEQLNPGYSYLDLLADGIEGIDIACKNASTLVREMRLELGTPQHVCFFLPAFRNTLQLLRPPVLPERLALSGENPWLVSDLLFKLGEELGVNHILVDLRAGLTELSSPLFFDPRIQRTLVTTTSCQSVQGTILALQELKKFASIFDKSRYDFFGKTRILTSFIPPIDEAYLRVVDIEEQFDNVFEEFFQEKDFQSPSTQVCENNEAEIVPKSWLIRSEFDQNLLGLGGLKEAVQAFERSATLPEICKQLCPYIDEVSPPSIVSTINASIKQNDLRQLRDQTRQIIYAETQNISSEFLTIEPYRRLAASFSYKVPNAAIFGAKGAGKTFFLKTLSGIKDWSTFCSLCGIDEVNNAVSAPIYWSQNESDEGKKLLTDLQIASLQEAGKSINDEKILLNHLKLRAFFSTPQQKLSSEWRELWFQFFCRCLGFTDDDSHAYEIEFRQHISDLATPIVFLCDGLEDLFSEWLLQDTQIEPLRVLLQDILRDIPMWSGGKFGLLVFIRKDIVRRAVTQNADQYFALYRNFEIKWSKEEALKLVGWLLNAQELQKYRSNQNSEDWDTKDFQSMCDDLIPLWGAKLGTQASNEAYTAYWVLSAVSDFKGNFQARDIIRFLNKAAVRQILRALPEDRLLSPPVIRSVLKECGEDKIEEIKTEMKNIASDLDKISSAQPVMPLTRETLEQIGISSPAALEEFGIILREGDNFYLPEIYRQGLGVKLSKGARPKVVTLMKKAWEKAGV